LLSNYIQIIQRIGNVATDSDDKPLQPIRIHKASAHRGPPPSSAVEQQQQQQADDGDQAVDANRHLTQLAAS
jgi:hypothetical protein